MYIHDYPSCERTYASLQIKGKDLNEESITEILDIEPSWFVAQGSPIGKTGRTVKQDAWCLSTRDVIESKDLEYHIHKLLEEVTVEKLKKVRATMDVQEIIIWAFWESKHGNGGPYVSPEMSLKLGRLGVRLELDIWFE